MSWAALGLITALAGTIFAVATDNAPLMALGFICFALALGATDYEAEAFNKRASDDLKSLNRHRLGYDEDDRAA